MHRQCIDPAWAREDEGRATREETDLCLRRDIRVCADLPANFLLQDFAVEAHRS